jgi:hypothetical protein
MASLLVCTDSVVHWSCHEYILCLPCWSLNEALICGALLRIKGCVCSFSVFLAGLPLVKLPPTRLSTCIVSLFGCVHIQSQAREIRRLVACTG